VNEINHFNEKEAQDCKAEEVAKEIKSDGSDSFDQQTSNDSAVDLNTMELQSNVRRKLSSSSSTLNDWEVSLKEHDGRVCYVTWKLVYRASLFGFAARDFHQACD
jgi:hypothetical protein